MGMQPGASVSGVSTASRPSAPVASEASREALSPPHAAKATKSAVSARVAVRGVDRGWGAQGMTGATIADRPA
ncbi:MAG: hypothetical protein U1F43_21960 [Myxococcota bacterium]